MRYLRARTIGLFSALGLGARLASPAPPPRSVEGLAAMLGAAANAHVRPSDVAWEPPRGALVEMASGRDVLFLASETEGGPRDLMRARVRLSIEGRPVAVTRVRDLTSTPLGDEAGLVAHGPLAAYATTVEGKVESVSVLDSRGTEGAVGATIVDDAMSAVTNLQETGTFAGLARVDVALDEPPTSVGLAFDGESLVMSVEGGRKLSLDLATSALRGDVESLGARAAAVPSLRKRPIHWAVDTVRAEVGPEPIAWLESVVFGARDALRRAAWTASGRGSSAVEAANGAPDAEPVAPVLDASQAGDDGAYWPPPVIASPVRGDADERDLGHWQPVDYPWLKRLEHPPGTPSPPPYFYRTTIRPDPQRPYAKVMVVAIDMRQLELEMEGGVEDPKPLTGVHGAGKIPRDPRVLGRVVGAFNGAFKTTHGEYGMMVKRRVLLPPKADAATVFVGDDGRVGLGTWGAALEIPKDMSSFRQNLEPLVADGKLSPSGRTQWGWQLAGTSMYTERSGLCVTKPGHLYYVWGDEVSASTLGKAMLVAGCTYGMHLDMNPHHTGFVFVGIRDYARKDYDAKLLTPLMEIMPERYLEFSPKDFFYLSLREPPRATDVAWAPDAGVPAPPAWLPGIWQAVVQIPLAGVPTLRSNDAGALDAVPTSVQVEMTAFDRGRVAFRARAGSRELGRAHEAALQKLDDADAHRALAAIGLGNAKEPRPLGLVLDGTAALAMRSGESLLVGDASGLRIVSVDEARALAAEHADLVQLPTIVDAGAMLPDARDHGSMHHRGGLCVLPGGRVVVGLATYDSYEPVAQALLRAGCTRAVALDRGSHHQAFVHRAGTPTPPLARYEQSVLYALGQPMEPRAFRWGGPAPTPDRADGSQ